MNNSGESMVFEALQAACSQNTDVLKPAEQKLKEWETEPGFYSVLLKVIANHSIHANIRWIAVLCFKNGVDRFWRKTAPNAISEEEKITIRAGLVSTFTEPVNQVATQLAVLISKIARFDCPREWPDLIPTLLSAVKSPEPLHQHRALLTTHHVVKTLSSKRLAGDKRLFQELTNNIFGFIYNLSNEHTERFLCLINENASTEVITESLEKALLTLRILRKLTVFGFKKLNDSQDAMEFMKTIFTKAKMTLECRKQIKGRGIYLLELCEKFIIHLTKILLDVLHNHPYSFMDFIQPCLEFSVYYVFTAEGITRAYERFIIQCLNMIKAILMCAEYKLPKCVDQSKQHPDTIQAHQIKQDFFTSVTLSEICRKLITHYFLLTQDDLALWDSDPEQFATDEGGESWKYTLRPCTESLFVALIHEYKEPLAPVLVDLIQGSHAPVPSDDLAAILRKDAVYNAVGLAAFFLYDEVDFDQWFSSTLTEEVRIKDNNYRIVRRAVVKLIGQWTGVKLSSSLRPALYGLILSLLHPTEDMAVRLAASHTLKLAIDDFEFNTDQFIEFLEPSFGLLFGLLKEAHECDTKMHVLYVLSFIVERVGLGIRPHADALIQYLPLLWDESENHNMLRCAIVSTLVHIIKALTTVPDSLSPFLLPVIALSTDTKLDSHVYLLEDGLDLWLAVLENSLVMTPDLLQLCRNMPALLESSAETLRVCLYIIQANIVLAPEQFLQHYGGTIMNTCASLISDMRSEGIITVMRLIELCLRAAKTQGVEAIKPLLPIIIESVHRGDEFPLVMSMYLSVISQVLLIQPETFSETISIMARSRMQNNSMQTEESNTQEGILARIMDIWLDKMPLVAQPERRKLLSLALSSLLTVQSNIILDRVCGIFLNVAETLNDIMKQDESGGISTDSLIVTPNSSPASFDDEEYETEHDRRKKRLAHMDPVHTIVLKDYFQSQLVILQTQVGLAGFENLMQTVDCETMAMLKEHIAI